MSTPDGYEALRWAVDDMGGAKIVACALRPELAQKPEEARDWLNRCLARRGRDKLDILQEQWIWRTSCDMGFHRGFDAYSKGCHYRRGEPITHQALVAEATKEALDAARKSEESNNKLYAVMRAANIKIDEQTCRLAAPFSGVGKCTKRKHQTWLDQHATAWLNLNTVRWRTHEY